MVRYCRTRSVPDVFIRYAQDRNNGWSELVNGGADPSDEGPAFSLSFYISHMISLFLTVNLVRRQRRYLQPSYILVILKLQEVRFTSQAQVSPL